MGEYYGMQGTAWRDPPILENPSETRKMGGRKILLFYGGNRLRLVGIKTPRASYWVSNTLLQTLSIAEMLTSPSRSRPSARISAVVNLMEHA